MLDASSTRPSARSFAAAAALLAGSCAHAGSASRDLPVASADPAARADIMIVTGPRERRFAEVPRSLSVTTREDLNREPFSNLAEVLGRAANLTLRSTLGNAKFSGIDIRGQGDTYVSNVLVMVDGIRLNAPDLSGADLSIVPPDLIERVEVIRGANTVRYGNGAVGGVINIVTRQPDAGAELGLRARVGSFATRGAGFDASWGGERFSAEAAADFYDSDGYRENSELWQSDVRARLRAEPTDWLGFGMSAFVHDDEFGLPGPISAAAFRGSDADRRASAFPFDGGQTDDDTLRADLRLGKPEAGELQIIGFDRRRQVAFRFGALADTPFGAIDEDTQRVDARYERDVSLGGRQHTLIVGVDGSNSDYARRSGPLNIVDTALTQGRLTQRGWFTALDSELAEGLQASFGYRQDSLRVDGRDSRVSDGFCDDLLVLGTPPNTVSLCNDPGGFRIGLETDPDGFRSDRWRNSALELGLVYSPTVDTHWFVAFAQSFRNPNVDELVLATDDLRPQTSRHWDAGVRHFTDAGLELGLAVFASDTRDEILFFLPGTAGFGLNRNAEDNIARRGVEVDVRWLAADWLELAGNVGYLRARFAGSAESPRLVPLVPEWTAGGSALLTWGDGFALSLAGSYVGTRPDGNDFGTSERPLIDGYFVAGAKFSWERNRFVAYAGIGNLFDEVYSASVYSSTFYPQPPRNVYAGFSYRVQSRG